MSVTARKPKLTLLSACMIPFRREVRRAPWVVTGSKAFIAANPR